MREEGQREERVTARSVRQYNYNYICIYVFLIASLASMMSVISPLHPLLSLSFFYLSFCACKVIFKMRIEFNHSICGPVVLLSSVSLFLALSCYVSPCLTLIYVLLHTSPDGHPGLSRLPKKSRVDCCSDYVHAGANRL